MTAIGVVIWICKERGREMTELDAATALAEGRKNRLRSAPLLPSDLTETDAYTFQNEAIVAYDSRQIGYKIGATSLQAQQIIGCDGPFFGPMFEADRIAPGSDVMVDETNLGLECEFAFQLSRAFPETGEDPGMETVKDAIAQCVPAFEIVGTRIRGTGFPSAVSCIADYGLNAGFCPGADMPGWKEQDLAAMIVTADVDGVETNRGKGENVYGHPLAALLWLVAALKKQGKRLEAGDWVSTGTCLGVIPMQSGKTITTRFSNGAELTIHLSANH